MLFEHFEFVHIDNAQGNHESAVIWILFIEIYFLSKWIKDGSTKQSFISLFICEKF